MSIRQRVRSRARSLAVRFGGLPDATGTIDTPTPEVARAVRRLWLRNTLSFAPVVDAAASESVTMTTYGPRLRDAWVALESIGAGSARPRRLVLWLDEPVSRLPWRLRRLRRRGLEIRYARPGFGVHTKYWPHLCSSEILGPLVLADDDVIYPPLWLAALREAHARTPHLVVAHRSKTILMTGTTELAPYIEWPESTSTEPSFARFATSVSGQLLPPDLQKALLSEGDRFLALAPAADDVWIHQVAVAHGYRTRQLTPVAEHWPFVPGSQKVALSYSNVFDGQNDRQLNASHSPETRERIWQDIAALDDRSSDS